MKNTSLWVRTAIIVAITLVGIYLVFGPRRAPVASDLTWQGIKNNLSENINLGLDLKGGSHLVMKVKTDEYLKTLTDNNAQAAFTAAQDEKLPVTDYKTVTEGNTFSITVNSSDPAQVNAVIDAAKKKVDLVNWSESTSGGSVTWILPSSMQTVLKTQAVEQAKRIIESRINAFGVKEPTIQLGSQASSQIILQMPGVDDPERVKKLIGDDAQLFLMKVVSTSSPAPVQTYPTEAAAKQSLGGSLGANRRIVKYLERPSGADQTVPPTDQFIVVEYPAVVDGSELRDASAVGAQGSTTDFQIAFSLKPAGAQKFGDWTTKNINNYMAVVLNGEAKSVAYIKSPIYDSGEISGRFSKESADDLALTLKSGALPAKIEYQEERTVGPSLGADSINAGVTASVAGLAFIVVFILFYYRGSGINAVVALVLNLILTMAALILLNSTLTLPGIAGFILGIGMAIDANVLIFERMREELNAGKNVAESVAIGFDKAFITIFDSNMTTIIAGIILYLFGTGPIRGFAVTLIIGLIINLFSAVYVSRTIYMWLLHRNPDMKKVSI